MTQAKGWVAKESNFEAINMLSYRITRSGTFLQDAVNRIDWKNQTMRVAEIKWKIKESESSRFDHGKDRARICAAPEWFDAFAPSAAFPYAIQQLASQCRRGAV